MKDEMENRQECYATLFAFLKHFPNDVYSSIVLEEIIGAICGKNLPIHGEKESEIGEDHGIVPPSISSAPDKNQIH